MRRWSTLLCACFAIAPACSVFGVDEHDHRCDLDEQAALLAGATAKNCGHATIGATSEVNACVKTALEKGTAFRATYDFAGFDSHPALVIVRNAEGKFGSLYWDSDPSGGSGEGARLERVSCSGVALNVGGDGIERYGCMDTTVSRQLICDHGSTL